MVGQRTVEDGRRGIWVFTVVVGLMIMVALPITVVAAVGIAVGNDGGSGGETTTTQAEISLQEFSITGDLTVPAGQVTLAVTNNGSAVHNLVAPDLGVRTADLAPSESAPLDLGNLEPGTYELLCDIVGHVEAGMVATLTVTDNGVELASTGEEHDGGHGGHGGDGDDVDWAALDQKMMESMLEFPAATEGIGNQPLEPTILADGTKQFELTAAITPWEVEPGNIVDAWTYNGTVPGPMIRVDVGDRVQVILHNELPMGTDIHWHGIPTPNDQDGVAPYTQDLIQPGETYTYEFVAERASIGMYHAHHHGHVAIVNGMFAPFIIGDTPIPYGQTISGETIPEDLEIAREIPMVLNDAGVIGLSLNGKSFPATEPYPLTQGDWVVFHYYNEGLTSHPMHLHQFPQLVFAKDGIPLDHPYYADTINVAPGERYSVLVHADAPGTWVWHCHILTHVERDGEMFGMVTALIVEPTV